MGEKQAYIKLDDNGNPWVACPYCNKRVFPITKSTKIENLLYKCKRSDCRKTFLVNIGTYKQVKKDDDGQLSIFDK